MLKNYDTKKEIISDLNRSLDINMPLENYVRERLVNVKELIYEFKQYPYFSFSYASGYSFVVWKQIIKIDSNFVSLEEILNRLSWLL